MDAMLAIAFALFAALFVARLTSPRNVIDLQVGLLSLFAIAYYALPVLFKDAAGLAGYFETDVLVSLFMHSSYFAIVILGVFLGQRAIRFRHVQDNGPLEASLDRRLVFFGLLSGVFYIYYLMTNDLTSYAAASRDDFLVGDRGPLAGIISSFAGLFLATIAVMTARELSRHRVAAALGMMVILGSAVFAVGLGQRLAVLTPIITLVAAMMLFEQRQLAVRLAAVAVIVLLVVSPVAVFLRSNQVEGGGRPIAASLANFQFGDSPIDRIFASIVDRSDLIENTIAMKSYIDSSHYVGWQYYYSVIVSPVPRLIATDKPYVLSDNGIYSGEISALAWRLKHGGVGSLTAFGAITAYRQGGWLVMYADALLVGLLFSLLARRFGGGSLIDRIFYVAIFSTMAVRKVPPSLMETLAGILPLLPLWLCFRWTQSMLAFRGRLA